jgi:hypothetical protein
MKGMKTNRRTRGRRGWKEELKGAEKKIWAWQILKRSCLGSKPDNKSIVMLDL